MKLRPLFALLALLVCSAAVPHGEAQTITFEKTAYYLQTVRPGVVKSVNNYFPAGQSEENWQKMISMQVYYDQKDITPEDFATNLAETVKRVNPDTSYEIIANPQTGEVIIDFITWTTEAPYISEFDVYRFQKHGDDIIALQYAYRSYGKLNKAFEEEIDDSRSTYILLLSAMQYPLFVMPK